jgi:predicted MPP superfamily phosphohydrolase
MMFLFGAADPASRARAYTGPAPFWIMTGGDEVPRGEAVNRAPSGHKMAFALGTAALLGPAALLLYAFFVEPFAVELTHHTLPGDVTQPLRIAHLSDLHSRGFGTRERAVAGLVEKAAPDLIVVTGDVVDTGSLEASRELFQHLRAPLGVWVVRGHAERARPIGDELAFYKSLGARLLENQGVAVRDDVWLMGLDDPSTGTPDLGAALAGAPPAAFKLALFHAPDHFAEVAGLFHLGLAGHTHGGQVRLPGFGPLWLPAGGHAYVQGWYSKNRSQLYVSRGIGTSNMPARFLSRPEVALIEIRPN